MNAIPTILALVSAVLVQDPKPPAGAQGQTPAPAKPATPAPAQGPTEPPAQGPAAARTEEKPTTSFTAEQLEQIVAPIALHPDSLLAMILMSSTYPLEIVEASRWVTKNSKLTGKALEDALKQNDWDPSVKAMCTFPTVLKQMSDNLDWTQDLGDAYLGQEKEVMDTVQKMRRKAMEAGSLKSNEQMKVTDEDKVIVIESTKTDVVYVPTYSPTVVYGAWSYPTYYYPPMYVAPPPGQAFFAFSVGVMWGAAIWGGCNWHGGCCNINVNNFNNFNRNTSINPQNRPGGAGGRENFKHDPSHRKGANYKNPQTAQKFGGAGGSNRVSKDQARGFDRGGSKAGPSAGSRPSAGTRPSGGAGAGGGARPSTRPSTGASGGGGRSSGALSGSRSPSMDRSASSRGASSRGGGGGSRGGGGGRGGGGRGGGRR